MFEAMKINADSYNAFVALMPGRPAPLSAVNGGFLVREIGTGAAQLKFFDEHDFGAMYRFKTRPAIASFTAVHVLPVNESGTPINPPRPSHGNGPRG